eukprot:CAMPEP_0172617164 /NCGR_PEP_ID=MMETSP1068-20121228/70077_1 /TAXON_ID=35684 /ORGANISM="Pseudopedinella elastica, Strain CCMP716" /LENGTH=323 /DNA_ID=CAMNT_0013422853 /DNA_START=347 /DNA_END=1317 /DNA_ORIENTATION=+
MKPAVSMSSAAHSSHVFGLLCLGFIYGDKDGSCLSVTGVFGPCDFESLFIYLPQPNKKEGHAFISLLPPESTPSESCLSRKSAAKESSELVAGPCSKSGAKKWSLVFDRKSGKYFIAANDQKSCVVRTAHSSEVAKMRAKIRQQKKRETYNPKYLFNGGSVQSCKEGGTLLQVVETSVQDVGFWLQGSDDSCFDGTRFRACNPNLASIVWGWGVSVSGNGDATRYLYKWHDRSKCLARKGNDVSLDLCDTSGARGWALGTRGKLSHEGKYCLVRSILSDAHVTKCSPNFESLSMALPAKLESAVAKSAGDTSTAAGRRSLAQV